VPTQLKELVDRADFVNEIIDVKQPKEIPTVKGNPVLAPQPK